MSVFATFALLFLAAEAPGGSLVISTQPDVEVFWDGVPLGKTSSTGVLTVEGIPQGKYRLTLSKEGFESLTLSVAVDAEPKTLRARLRPASGEDPAEPGAEPSSAVPDTKPEASRQRTRPTATAPERRQRSSPPPVPAPRPRRDPASDVRADASQTTTSEPRAQPPAEDSSPAASTASGSEPSHEATSVRTETDAVRAPEESGPAASSQSAASDGAADADSTSPSSWDTEEASISGWSGWPITVLVALAAGAALLGLRRGRSGSAPNPGAPNRLKGAGSESATESETKRAAAGGTDLLSEMREREEALDQAVDVDRNVVEVEVTDIRSLDESMEVES